MEAYHPDNVGRGTGGPQAVPFCVTTEELSMMTRLTPLTMVHSERIVNEGKYHNGLASVVQYIGQKKVI